LFIELGVTMCTPSGDQLEAHKSENISQDCEAFPTLTWAA
jgi:hypothetical protein